MLIRIDHEAELHTILAALRYYQSQGMGEPENRPLWLHDIATKNDEQISLNAEGIDQLCQEINVEPDAEELSIEEVSTIDDALTEDLVQIDLRHDHGDYTDEERDNARKPREALLEKVRNHRVLYWSKVRWAG